MSSLSNPSIYASTLAFGTAYFFRLLATTIFYTFSLSSTSNGTVCPENASSLSSVATLAVGVLLKMDKHHFLL